MTPQRPPKTSVSPHPFETTDPANFETGLAHHSGKIVFQIQPGAKPLPEYELIRKLGEGGCGQVWLAKGPGGFEVALKFLRLGEAAGETELKAMQMMKGIRHPNLLDLFGVWEKEGWLIVAMGLADRSVLDRLKEALAQGQPGIPKQELLGYMRKAAKGLDFLAEKGILHRDVKPHNLFLSGGGIKVADYGLAKVLQRTMASVSTKMTPAYAAPEIIDGKGAKTSDQYSLAITYCQLRTNRLPFTGSMLELIAAHMAKPPDLSMLPPDEQPALTRALAKDPKDRWPDCKSFVEALAVVPMPSPTRTRPIPPQLPPRPKLSRPPAPSKGFSFITLICTLLCGLLLGVITLTTLWMRQASISAEEYAQLRSKYEQAIVSKENSERKLYQSKETGMSVSAEEYAALQKKYEETEKMRRKAEAMSSDVQNQRDLERKRVEAERMKHRKEIEELRGKTASSLSQKSQRRHSGPAIPVKAELIDRSNASTIYFSLDTFDPKTEYQFNFPEGFKPRKIGTPGVLTEIRPQTVVTAFLVPRADVPEDPIVGLFSYREDVNALFFHVLGPEVWTSEQHQQLQEALRSCCVQMEDGARRKLLVAFRPFQKLEPIVVGMTPVPPSIELRTVTEKERSRLTFKDVQLQLLVGVDQGWLKIIKVDDKDTRISKWLVVPGSYVPGTRTTPPLATITVKFVTPTGFAAAVNGKQPRIEVQVDKDTDLKPIVREQHRQFYLSLLGSLAFEIQDLSVVIDAGNNTPCIVAGIRKVQPKDVPPGSPNQGRPPKQP